MWYVVFGRSPAIVATPVKPAALDITIDCVSGEEKATSVSTSTIAAYPPGGVVVVP
jgi:arginine/lysine/ornithine decarboxylase